MVLAIHFRTGQSALIKHYSPVWYIQNKNTNRVRHFCILYVYIYSPPCPPLAVCLSVCRSVYLSICLSACLSVCLSDFLLDCRFVLIFSSNDKIYLLTILFIYYLSYVYLDFLNISPHENLFYPGRLIV